MKSENNHPSYQIHLSTLHSLPILSITITITIFLCLFGPAAANLSNQTDQLALLELKSQISSDPNDFFSSWNDSHHFCQWRGVECGRRHKRVVGLDLGFQNINGTISPHIGNLSFLRYIFFVENDFHGEIPQQITRLSRLRMLHLSNNTLVGQVPNNLSHCHNLRMLSLSFNRLVGSIPEEVGSLKMLYTLALDSNHFTGFIPRSLGNLSSVTWLSVTNNNLEGSIPGELGQLANLTVLKLGVNNLSGTIPSSLYNISTLYGFEVSSNHLTGTLPSSIGLTLPNLEDFRFGGNSFAGKIPPSFLNASQLQVLELASNRFTGQVPSNLGVLQKLLKLSIWGNFFGSNATNDLSFITSLSNCTNLQRLNLGRNNLGGEIPRSVGNLSVALQVLVLADNYVLGDIPAELENIVNLFGLGLEDNLLSGSIPSSIGKLVYLQMLNLNGNMLSGRIPSSLGNITALYALNLSHNKLEGNVPESIGNCEDLKILQLSQNSLNGSIPPKVLIISSLYLNLSGNLLTGSLPVEVGKLKSISQLDVSNNKLTGNIPSTIGECLSLEVLYIQGNFFQGIIPSTLAALKGILELDLSRNNLSGQIPEDMEKLVYLKYFNLSFNNLEGEVSKNGVFGNASVLSVDGNSELCGGIKELQLPSCRGTARKPRVALAWKIVIIIACGVVLVLIIISIIFIRKERRKGPTTVDLTVEKLLRISYHQLYKATEGFSPRNLVGSGAFGSVYQGKLNDEDKLVAVKVLNLEKSGASKSFTAECSALRNIRHRNLVKIKTYCSSLDSNRRPFKALVYEFMSNGNLDMWLHEGPGSLGVLQRINIAIDVANAIHYLHDLCEPQIVHCDLKPSNILLDDELIAHVGDFGLARLLSKSVDSFAQSSSMGIMGTIGYAAPEYGMGSEASKYGDVYSFGVVLLEMLTGKRPTDEMFNNGMNLHKYVRTALEEENVMRIMDPTIVKTDETEIGILVKLEKCVIGVVEIGMRCSTESPKERMGMDNVVKELHHIRTAFLSL